MKHPMVRIVLAVWLAAIALIPFVSALAQDDSVDLLEAVGIVRGAYGEVLVYGVEVDTWQTAAGTVTCWNFVTDAGEFCISTVDGSILTGDDSLDDDAPEIEATEEADDDDAPEMEATEEADNDDAPEMEATEEADDDDAPEMEATEEADDDDDDREESVAAPVTLSQLETAIAAGLNIYPTGVVREASISTDDDTGVVIIKIEFDDDREVEVNSESGDVVDFGFSGSDDDDSGSDDDNSGSDDDNSGSDDDNSGSDDDNSGDDDDNSGDDDDNSGDDDDDDSGDDDDGDED